MTGAGENGLCPAALMVLAPHPDDDVLGCSHLMRRVARAGGRVVVVWLTDGGASHGALEAGERAALVARRQAEALAGVAALGVTPEATYFLGLPDGELAAHADIAVARLEDICRRHALDTAVVTDGGDPHPDHRAAFAIARRLTLQRLYGYPISVLYDGDAYAPPANALRVPCESSPAKRAALMAHRSQCGPEEGGAGATYPLTAAAINRFCAGPEIFIPVEGRAP